MIKNIGRLTFVLASTLFATQLHAAGAPAPTAIKVGIIGPFTGGSASMGESIRDGALLAVKEINDSGGVDVGGKKMKIDPILRDDEAKNERGVAIATEFVSMPDLVAVVGTANTGVVLAGDKTFLGSNVIRIISGATGSTIRKQWVDSKKKELNVFRLAALDLVQTELVVKEANRLGAKKVAIIHDDTAYGVAGRDDLLENLKKFPDIKLVATEKFKVGDQDMNAQVLQMKNSGAEAVLIFGIGPELARVTTSMKKQGFNVPVIGSWTLSMAIYLDNAGDSSEGVRLVQGFLEEPYSEKAKKFIDSFHKEYKVDRIKSPMSASQSYDSVKILAEAIHQAGSLDRDKIREALEDLKAPVSGVITEYKKPFSKWDGTNPDSHEALHKENFIVAGIKGKKVVFLDDKDREHLKKISEGKE